MYDEREEYDVIIIGAGVAGGTMVRQLPNGLSVLILEKGDEVIPTTSSSFNECGKLHSGMHYIGDQITAEKCLRSSIQFARTYPNALLSQDPNAPCRRGQHFILEASRINHSMAERIAGNLYDIYSELVKQDPKNQVFGDPTNFIKILDPSEYKHLAEKMLLKDQYDCHYLTSIKLGIETGESQIDFEKLRGELTQDIHQREHTKFIPKATVTSIQRHPSKIAYVVTTTDKTYQGRAVVNCTWNNIESLEEKLNLQPDDMSVIIRIKAFIVIKLPAALRDKNTCIFSCGPFCSITTSPDGTAILTSEPTTNVGFFQADSEISQDIQDKLNHLNLKHPYGLNTARKILDECSEYISDELRPLFKDSEILELRVGFVRMLQRKEHTHTTQYTQTSIHEGVHSPIHYRSLGGGEAKDCGYYRLAAMKMSYAVTNAQTMSGIIEEDFKIIEQVEHLMEDIQQLFPRQGEFIRHVLCTDYRSKMIDDVKSGKHKEDKAAYIADFQTELQKHFASRHVVSERGMFSSSATTAVQAQPHAKAEVEAEAEVENEDVDGHANKKQRTYK